MTTEICDIPSFLDRALGCVERAASRVRLQETRETRIMRRFSIGEVAEILNCDRSFLHRLFKHPDAPQGEVRGRENTLSVDDIMKLRAIAASRQTRHRSAWLWRKPGDPLPVIVVSCQKGGTGKSVTAAHLAQYASLYMGLRVGVIDADPQATCSLYFATSEDFLGEEDNRTFVDFMGIPEPGKTQKITHSAAKLNTFWLPTPWPGLRIIPGGSAIQEADISMYFLSQSKNPENRRFHRFLRDALARWRDAHPPRTNPEDFADADGRFKDDVYQAALNETFDLIVIDTPPSLTLPTLNTIVAGDTLVIPQTMRGFDLATLRLYLGNLNDYFKLVLQRDPHPIQFSRARPFILPTIVNRNNDTDIRTIGEIYREDREVISPVFYRQSDGAANAFRDYKSIYEYTPDRTRRASVQAFVANANAVNDAILSRALPHLPSRGFANAFIHETYPEGAIPMWSDNVAATISEDAA